jgi:hypothetical protein
MRRFDSDNMKGLAPPKYSASDALFIGADKVSMASSEISAAFIGPVQPLQLSVELLANLIYLARRTEIHSAKQNGYLDWAANVIEDLQHHPKLHDCGEA